MKWTLFWSSMASAVLFPGIAPAAQAQTPGALPLYRCVSADGSSSRMSRSPCAGGETGSARQATAAMPVQKPAITHQPPPGMPAPALAHEESQHHPHNSRRAGRRR